MLRHAGGHIGACTSCARHLQLSSAHLHSLCSAHSYPTVPSWLMQYQPSKGGLSTPRASPSQAHPWPNTIPALSTHGTARLRLPQAVPDHASSAPAPLPLVFTGQVMSAASNMVRVELDPLMEPSTSGINSGASSNDSNDTNGSTDTDSSSTDGSRSSSGGGASGSGRGHGVVLPRTQLLCSLRSLLKKLNQTVLVGDRVRVGSVDWNLGRGQVEQVLPRQSELTDPAVANVDFALLVFAVNNPPFEEAQVTRFLVALEASGIPFRLLLNKVDLVSQEELDRRVAQVRSWGYDPLIVSCEGEGRGLQSVIQALEKKTAVVAGPSGAGKSSLINAIRLGRHRADQAASGARGSSYGAPPPPPSYGAPPLSPSQGAPPLQFKVPASAQASASLTSSGPSQFLAVGDLNRRGRGKHTTTTISLIDLPGSGRLADTPGFSQPSLDQVSSTELSSHFPEFQEVIEREGACQYSNCQHMLEPGCSINNHDPPLQRHVHYAKFLLEIKEREENDIKSLQAGKRAREGHAKVKTAGGGRVRNEVKLDASKHRRTSRGTAKQHLMDAWED